MYINRLPAFYKYVINIILIFNIVTNALEDNQDESELDTRQKELPINNMLSCEIPEDTFSTKYIGRHVPNITSPVGGLDVDRSDVNAAQILTVSCNEGYKLGIFAEEHHICINGKWNSPPKTCGKSELDTEHKEPFMNNMSTCKIPNNTVSTKYKGILVIQYEANNKNDSAQITHRLLEVSCNEGYKLSPFASHTFECFNGIWDSSLAACSKSEFESQLESKSKQPTDKLLFTCVTPDDTLSTNYLSVIIPTVTSVDKGYAYTTTSNILIVSCKKGYKLSPFTQKYFNCINGKWNSSPTTCSKSELHKGYNEQSINSELSCEIPDDTFSTTYISQLMPNIKYFDKVGADDDEQIKKKKILTISCNEGYTLSPFAEKHYNCINGKWDSSPTTCIKSELDTGYKEQPINNVHYCDIPDYTLSTKYIGQNVVISEPDDKNGDNIEKASRLEVSCNDGYKLGSFAQTNFNCINGKWDSLLPRCLPLDAEQIYVDLLSCVIPENTPSTTYISQLIPNLKGINKYKDKMLIVSCNEGYELSPFAELYFKCINGKWNSSPKACTKSELNAGPQEQSIGSVQESVEITSQDDSTHQDKNYCRFPKSPSNGKYIYLHHDNNQTKPGDYVPIGSALILSCKLGYEDTSSLKTRSYCIEEGQWRPTLTTCKKSEVKTDECFVFGKDGKGNCTYIGTCKGIQMILNRNSKNNNFRSIYNNILKKYQCGFTGNVPKVCCYTDISDENFNHTLPEATYSPDYVSSHNNIHLLPNECGIYSSGNLIYGEEKANLFEFPWMALFKYGNVADNGFQCSGTIINNRYILTAASCIPVYIFNRTYIIGVEVGVYHLTSQFSCKIGDQNISLCSDPRQELEIEDVVIHPKYSNSTKMYNIALVRLSRPLQFTRGVRPICLPTFNNKYKINNFDDNPSLTITGWGGKFKYDSRSADLLKVPVTVINHTICKIVYNEIDKFDYMDDKQLCASSLEAENTCQAEVGGPLLLLTKNLQYIQFGISSFDIDCKLHYPGLFTRVDYFMNWILDTLKI